MDIPIQLPPTESDDQYEPRHRDQLEVLLAGCEQINGRYRTTIMVDFPVSDKDFELCKFYSDHRV